MKWYISTVATWDQSDRYVCSPSALWIRLSGLFQLRSICKTVIDIDNTPWKWGWSTVRPLAIQDSTNTCTCIHAPSGIFKPTATAFKRRIVCALDWLHGRFVLPVWSLVFIYLWRLIEGIRQRTRNSPFITILTGFSVPFFFSCK
jgi:hypothetical protein